MKILSLLKNFSPMAGTVLVSPVLCCPFQPAGLSLFQNWAAK